MSVSVSVSVSVVGAVAGQGQEHLVEGGLGDADRGDRELAPRAGAIRTSAARSASVSGDVEAAGLGGEHRLLAEQRGVRRRRPRRSGAGSASRSCSVEVPTDDFSSSGVPSATLRPRSITAIRSASWSASSRYWVVSRTVQPSATRSRMVSHIWPRVRGSRPVVGSSRKISGGRVIRLAARSSRRRMPPENCEIGRSAASSSPKLPSSSAAVGLGPARGQALEPAEEPEVLAGGEVLVDRGVLPGDADQLAHLVGAARDVDAEDLGAAAVDRQQRREHPEHRGLAGAVGAEHAEDLAAAYLEVDAVDGAEVAEGLDEPGGVDGEVAARDVECGHAHDSASRAVSDRLHSRFHRTGVSGAGSCSARSWSPCCRPGRRRCPSRSPRSTDRPCATAS